MPSDVRETAASTLLSGVHDRQRREERGIQKIDLQRARRYGMKEFQDNGRIRYTYGGIVFIYCPLKNKAVTSWTIKGKGGASDKSGTKISTPILLDKHDYGSAEDAQKNQRTHETISELLSQESSREIWTSHSVLVVDMSGSMRSDDVNGARCRSDGVWMSLARDYIKKPLTEGTRSHFDLISIVVMKDTGAEVVLRNQPTTWVLYNKLIDMREWSVCRPAGHGYYLPAIDEAEKLLTSNIHASCSLSLLFFSDGKPSDNVEDRPLIVKKIGKVASKFGRRLSIACIGMADEDEDFSTLSDMITEAKEYGSQATFGKPSLDTTSLSSVITNLASSLTTSKTEMTELGTNKAKLVRMDIEREKLDTPDTEGEWKIYKSDTNAPRNVVSFRSWDFGRFVLVVDQRCQYCFSDVAPCACPKCKASFICHDCFVRGNDFTMHNATRHNNGQSECKQQIEQLKNGSIVHKKLPSWSVAVKEKVFGEGAERFVRKVRFLDSDGKFVGPVMVAKESRFIEESHMYRDQVKYHKEFMRAQDIASNLAKKYNEALSQVQTHFRDSLHDIPRIEFIEPLVLGIEDNGIKKSFLIEKFLDGKYKKFNNNLGYVDNDTKQLIEQMSELGLGGTFNEGLSNQGVNNNNGLGAIVEEDEEESDDEEQDIFDSNEAVPYAGNYSDLQDEYFPQAFSHFTYQKSKGHFMVVDLQGVFRVNTDGSKVYELTDPVVHKHRTKRNIATKNWTFGRTDRGEMGMKAFFASHRCTDACKLLGLNEVDAEKVCRKSTRR